MAYIVRHAESAWNAAKPSQKTETLRDADLSAGGVDQLAEVGRIAKSLSVKRVVCSPLTRALRTAIAAADAAGAAVEVVSWLREVRRDWSDVGSPGPALARRFPGVAGLADLKDGWWADTKCACDLRHECDKCVQARALVFREALRANRHTPTLYVTHGDFIAALTGWDAKNAEFARVIV